jgi:glycosyltransferase involved in cell wall biosynthesis
VKIGFIYAASAERQFPQYAGDFDRQLWCNLDDFITRYPRAVMRDGIEPVFFYLSSVARTRLTLTHKYGFRMERVPVRWGAGSLEREFSPGLPGIAAREGCDLLHVYSYYRNWRWPDMYDWLALCCRTRGLPFVTHFQGGEFPGTGTRLVLKRLLYAPKRRLKQFTLNSAQRILSCNRLEIERLANPTHPQWYGIRFRPDQCLYVPNIVDTASFRPMPRDEARRLLGWRQDTKYVLYVGFLREAKGVQHLIRALPALNKTCGDTVLVLVGRGEHEAALRTEAGRLPEPGKVVFAGPVANAALGPYYSAADVHSLPSYAEGLPSVVLESLACGTPSVSAAVGGIPEVLGGGAGLLVPPRDEGALAGAIADVLQGRFVLKEARRQSILHEHSYAKAGDLLLGEYERILNLKRGTRA